MPHEKQGATTLLDEEARFEDKGKFAPILGILWPSLRSIYWQYL